MAYIDASHHRARTGPVAAVIAIHAGIGYLLVTGLGATIVERLIEPNPEAIDIPLDPPPPPEDPKPKTEADPVEQKFVAPVPPLDFKRPVELDIEPAKFPPIDDLVLVPQLPKLPEAKITPSLAFDPVPAKPRNNPGMWVTPDDYPSGPLRRGQEGITKFRLEIAANGKVESCTVTGSSGVEQLDQATCRYVERRARFNPARDASDKATAGSYSSAVRWQIPD